MKTDEQNIIINGQSLVLTNQDKILWPDEGITKAELIDYYRKISKYILRHLFNRPQSLHRFPNGINEKGFYQKNIEDGPEWIKTIKIKSESTNDMVNYMLCNDETALLYMANLACIEMNPWNSKVGSLDKPDWLVFDIDPGKTNTFEQVIETALVIKSLLDKAMAISFAKTSGASGMHIYVPLGAKYTYEEGKTFAQMIATMTSEQLPHTTTTERNLKLRNGKIYIDYLQNSMGQTVASVYSVRPMPGATVSTPLFWHEVKNGLYPTDFTIKNVVKRIEKQGDIFKPVLGKGVDLSKSLKLISA